MRKVDEIPFAKLGIPDDTLNEMGKDRDLKKSVGILFEVVSSIQDVVDDNIKFKDIYRDKNNLLAE